METRTTAHIVNYTAGFIASLVLTGGAYIIATNHLFEGWAIMWVLMALAVAQLIVQLVFFLHFGHGTDGKWNKAAFWFIAISIFILAIGSLWIMHHMDYNMMPPELMDSHMMEQRDRGF